MSSSYYTLRDDPDFSDVTLVCEEDQQIEAHKIILATSSTFFNAVLKRNKHSHPMIYMKGIQAKYMLAIVDYIYSGETNIKQEDLDGFLALAVELKLKGLDRAVTEGITLDKYDDQSKEEGQQPTKPNFKQEHKFQTDDAKNNDSSTPSKDANNSKVTVDKTQVASNISMEDLKLKLDTMIERADDGIYSWKCTVCGKGTKESARQNMRKHTETHIEGLSYQCTQCDIISRSSNGLNLHVSRHHRN